MIEWRMEIYEIYLLLFRECFHIRYPNIKSSLQLDSLEAPKQHPRYETVKKENEANERVSR